MLPIIVKKNNSPRNITLMSVRHIRIPSYKHLPTQSKMVVNYPLDEIGEQFI